MNHLNTEVPTLEIYQLPANDINDAKFDVLLEYNPSGTSYDNMFQENITSVNDFNEIVYNGDFIEVGYIDTISRYMDTIIAHGRATALEKVIVLQLLNYFAGEEAESVQDYEDKISILEGYWNTQNFSVCDSVGDISAYTLQLAKYSLDFWSNTPDALLNIHNINERWIWLAIVGAIVTKDVMGGLVHIAIAEYYVAARDGYFHATAAEQKERFVVGAVIGSTH